MRGAGQIAELAEIAEPDVAVIVSIGPVHLELLGSIEAIAAAKAELIAAPAGPAARRSCRPAKRCSTPTCARTSTTVTFGDGGDVRIVAIDGATVTIDHRGAELMLEVPFTQAHLRSNLLAAVAAAIAIGVSPTGRVELALGGGPGRAHRARRWGNGHR